MTYEEEREQAIKEYTELTTWALGLTEKQINHLCDSGYYNDTMRGYLIEAGRNAGLDREAIKELLNGLRLALSERSKADADRVYMDF